ncbi:MAG TPA: DUF4199 domain-containing protein [Flavisolibacter sp.]
MQNENSSAHGIRWGVIIGLVYCLLLFLRFYLGADNAGIFTMVMFVSFITVIILLFFCGKTFRNKAGGYVEMKEAFKTMFIAILIFEFFYAVFTLVYLKYIDPQFFDKFRVSTENILIMAKQSQVDIDKALTSVDQWGAQAKSLTVFDFLKTYLYNVAITGLFALLFAFIIKKKQPFPDDNFNRG